MSEISHFWLLIIPLLENSQFHGNDLLRPVYPKREWLIWTGRINTCIISDQLGLHPIFGATLGLLRNLSNLIRVILLAAALH